MQFYLTWVNEGNVADSNNETDVELVLVVIFRGLAYFFQWLVHWVGKIVFSSCVTKLSNFNGSEFRSSSKLSSNSRSYQQL